MTAPTRITTGPRTRVDTAVRRLARTHRPVCAYVYDLAGLRDHAARVRAALPGRCRLLYAVKANDRTPILSALTGVVDGFEVASAGELQTVLEIDRTARVAFGGPGKTDAELAAAVSAGVDPLNVESVHELRRLDLIAGRQRRRQAVCLRVNLAGPLPGATVTMAGGPTQFGVDEADVPAVVGLAARLENVDLRGFHFHPVSNHLDAAAHRRLVEHELRLAQHWAADAQLALTTVDVGGGIGVDVVGQADRFDWDGFLDGLRPALRRLPSGCEVLFECGRFLVAAAGTYAAEVVDLKHNHGRWFAVVRGGTHHFRLPASWGYSHRFRVVPLDSWPYPFPRPSVGATRVTVVGQLCTPKDVLAREHPVGQLRAGDVLAFPCAGAYAWTISHHDFLSHPHPDQVWLTDDGP